jgi:hypothetical protein
VVEGRFCRGFCDLLSKKRGFLMVICGEFVVTDVVFGWLILAAVFVPLSVNKSVEKAMD